MFSKKSIVTLLIIAMGTSNLGMSTFAMSISNSIVKRTERSNEITKDVSHKYYEQFKYEKTTLLLNDDGGDLIDEKPHTSNDNMSSDNVQSFYENKINNTSILDENKNDNNNINDNENNKEKTSNNTSENSDTNNAGSDDEGNVSNNTDAASSIDTTNVTNTTDTTNNGEINGSSTGYVTEVNKSTESDVDDDKEGLTNPTNKEEPEAEVKDDNKNDDNKDEDNKSKEIKVDKQITVATKSSIVKEDYENKISTISMIEINEVKITTKSEAGEIAISTISEMATLSEVELDKIFSLASSSNLELNQIATNSIIFAGTLPPKVYYRNIDGRNCITSLRDQQHSMLCEMFAMVASAESYMLIHYNDYVKNIFNDKELDFSELYHAVDQQNGIISPLVERKNSIVGRGEYTGSLGFSDYTDCFYWSKVGGIMEKYAPFEVNWMSKGLFLPYNDGSKSLARVNNAHEMRANYDYLTPNEKIVKMKEAINDHKAIILGQAKVTENMQYKEDETNETFRANQVLYAQQGDGHEMCVVGYNDNIPKEWTGSSTNGGFYIKDSSMCDYINIYSYEAMKNNNVGMSIMVSDFEPTRYNFDNNYFWCTQPSSDGVKDEEWVFTLDGQSMKKENEKIYGFTVLNENYREEREPINIEIYELESGTDLTTEEMSFDIDYMTPIYSNSFNIENNLLNTMLVDAEIVLGRNKKYAIKTNIKSSSGIYRGENKVYRKNDYEWTSSKYVPDFSILTNEIHNVRYDANGGKFSNGNTYKSFTLMNNDLLEVEEPTYEGLRFVGWSNKKDSLMPAGLDTRYHACYGDTYYAIWESTSGNKNHTFSRSTLDNVLTDFGDISPTKITFQVAGSLPIVAEEIVLNNDGFRAYKVSNEEIIIFAPNGSNINLIPQNLFSGLSGLGSIEGLNNCKVNGQKDFSRMFYECTSLVTVDLSSFDTSNATNMSNMFYDCHNLNKIYVSNKFNASNVTNSNQMFYNCMQLKGYNGGSKFGFDNSKIDKTYAHLGQYLWNAYPTIEFDETAVFAFGYEQTNGTRYFNEEYILPLGDYASDIKKEFVEWRGNDGNKYDTLPKGLDVNIKLTPVFKDNPYQGVQDDCISIEVKSEYGRTMPLKIDRNSGQIYSAEQLEKCVYGYDKDSMSIKTYIIHWNDGRKSMENAVPIGPDYAQDIDYIEVVWTIKNSKQHILDNLTLRPRKSAKIRDAYTYYTFSYFMGCVGASSAEKVKIIFACLDSSSYGESDLVYNGKTYNYRESPDTNGFNIYTNFEGSVFTILLVIPTGHEFVIEKIGYNHKFISDYNRVLYEFNEFSREDIREKIVSIEGFELVKLINVTDLGVDYTGLMGNNEDLLRIWSGEEYENDDYSGTPTEWESIRRGLFEGCKNLESINLSGFDFSEIKNTQNMFSGCTKLKTITFNSTVKAYWKNIENMQGMFKNCSILQNVNLYSFSSENLQNVSDMFNGCSSLTTILTNKGFSFTNVQNADNVFSGCSKIKGGENTTYRNATKLYGKVDEGTGNPGYFTNFEKEGSVAHITYHLNDGEWIQEPSEYIKSGTTEIELPDKYVVKKDGFEFKGWYDNSGCEGTNCIKYNLVSGKNEYEFWAKWEEPIIVISKIGIKEGKVPTKNSYYVGDSIEGEGIVITATKNNGTTEEITYSNTTKNDFTFNPSTFTEAGSNIAVSVTYKGVTLENAFTVKVAKKVSFVFDLMGYGTNFTSETETGKTLSEPTSIPETTGYEFLYWYEEDGGIAYNFSKIIGNESASTRTLKAKWKPVEYIIKYKVESNVSISKTEFNKVYGKVAEELIKPSKEGYNFVGWFIDNNTFEKPYTIYMDIYEQGKTEYYIYPKWTTEKYRVDFKLHNNAYIYYFQQVNQGERLISPTVPYYEGHRFIGWYYNDRAWNFMTDVVMESFTLMAKWEKVEEVKSISPSGGNGGSRGGDAATNLQQQQQQKAAAEQPTRQGNQEVNQSSFGTQAVMKSEPIKNVQAKMEGGQLKFTKENGERITGMTKVSVDGKDGVYYFNNNSTLYCGWMKDENNNYHYFGANGKMVTNQEVKVGDKTFKINEKGELDQVGLSVDDKKGIFDRCGVKEYTAEITKNGSINGQAGTLRNNQQDTWSAIIINPITGQKELAKGLTKIVQEDGVHSYYFDQNGIMQIGWLIVEGKLQLFSLKNGRLVTID